MTGSMWRRRLTTTRRPSLIVGGRGTLTELSPAVREAVAAGRRAYVISDEHVMHAWGERVLYFLGDLVDSDNTSVVPPGEESKRVSTAEDLWEWLARKGARRDDLVIALGGGVVGDLAGFVASTYMRGVGLWQIPTSLIAQVDSSVGGKVAVNLPAGKNLIGTFYQPDLVFVDTELVSTLPAEEYLNGLGEVVKYALLSKTDFLSQLEGWSQKLVHREEAVLDATVAHCLELKADIVEADEQESGGRAVLNLGHTLAHALEATAGYGGLRHGEAVAVGLLYSLAVSEEVLGLSLEIRPRVRDLLEKIGLPTETRLPPTDRLLEVSARDKKVRASGIGFVGLRALGEPVPAIDVPSRVLVEKLAAVRT